MFSAWWLVEERHLDLEKYCEMRPKTYLLVVLNIATSYFGFAGDIFISNSNIKTTEDMFIDINFFKSVSLWKSC